MLLFRGKQLLTKPKSLLHEFDLCSKNLRSSIITKQQWYASAQLTSDDELSNIIHQFPPQIDYAFGYGSAVLRQQNSNPTSSMIDVIMAVPDPYQWHTDNLKQHPDHYSMMGRVGGASFVTWLQTNFGAKLYFHPYVNLDIDGTSVTQELKYGVVSTSDLMSDLRNWDYLYLAGRMHKPIATVKSEEGINEAQRINLQAAVAVSLLLLGNESFLPTSKLYATIASLSYTGDFRMETGAEDPNKVSKLVKTSGMLDLWEAKYADIFSSLQKLGLLSLIGDSAERTIEFNPHDTATRSQLMKELPAKLRTHSEQIIGVDGQNCLHKGSVILRNEIAKIVAPAARNQGIKGVFTAGSVKSWKYSMAKFSKGRLKK
jgi:translocator assembly and maintenance protein 41